MAEVLRDTFFGSDPGAILPGDAGFHDTKATSEFVQFYYNQVAEKDFCRIVFPGNKQSIWDQPVREKDKIRYARHWALYKEGKDQLQGQTMLESWGDMDQGSIEIYHQFHIKTVEQLAQLPDVNMSNFPPGHASLAYRHRELAKTFMEQKAHSMGYDEAVSLATRSQEAAEEAIREVARLRQELDAEKSKARITEAEFPKHAGGPWYLLSNGEKIKGKGAAQEAELKLAIG